MAANYYDIQNSKPAIFVVKLAGLYRIFLYANSIMKPHMRVIHCLMLYSKWPPSNIAFYILTPHKHTINCGKGNLAIITTIRQGL